VIVSASQSNALALIEQIRRKAPEYLDLLTAVTDREFETAFDAVLGPAIAHLEENKSNFSKLDEDGLTAVLRVALSVPGLAVSQEKHSNGHVDITIEATHSTPVRKKLGEAKIYDGYVYHIGGLQQLIGRYSTGREGRGLLIVYCRKANIASLLKELRRRMDEEMPCSQAGQSKDHIHKWSFLTSHGHSSGESLEVGHIACNLYCGT
jgi:hypothetical protein